MASDAVSEIPGLNELETVKKISENFHDGRLDLNIIYNKRKHMKARFIEGIQKMVVSKMVANKVTKEKIDAFNERIHKPEGSIALKDLR
jgi:hypothetical protein